MFGDPYANQQEIYELRSSLDKALTRIDELTEQLKWQTKNWESLYLTHVKLLRSLGQDAGLPPLADDDE